MPALCRSVATLSVKLAFRLRGSAQIFAAAAAAIIAVAANSGTWKRDGARAFDVSPGATTHQHHHHQQAASAAAAAVTTTSSAAARQL